MIKMLRRLRIFVRDESGQALTEYVVLIVVVTSLCCYLYYPHNGFYKAFRSQFDLTTTMLMLPGP